MLKINATALLFILELLLILAGISVFLFLKNKKQPEKEFVYKENTGDLKENAEDIEKTKIDLQKSNEELTSVKSAFTDIKKKLDLLRSINIKLKKTIATLVPDAEKSKEYKKLISELEDNHKELDLNIETLEAENKDLDKQILTFKDEVSGLNKRLKDAVSKPEHDRVVADRERLEMKVEHLEKKLKEKQEEYHKLEKEHMWLEKEFNALYNNVNEEALLNAQATQVETEISAEESAPVMETPPAGEASDDATVIFGTDASSAEEVLPDEKSRPVAEAITDREDASAEETASVEESLSLKKTLAVEETVPFNESTPAAE